MDLDRLSDTPPVTDNTNHIKDRGVRQRKMNGPQNTELQLNMSGIVVYNQL